MLLGSPAMAAPGDIALVGAELRTAAAPPVAGGTVLLRGDRILAAGVDVSVPSDATTIDVRGRVITPGFIAADTSVGLLEVGLEPRSNDAKPKVQHPIRAAVRADRAFDIASSLVAVARRHGVTSVVSVPAGGLVSGRAGFFDLLDARDLGAAKAFVGLVGLYARLGEAGAAAVGGSRLTAMGTFEEYLDDAKTYRTGRASFRRRALYRMPTSRLDLEAAIPVLERRMPLVVEVHRASDIRAVVALAKAQRLNLILIGANEAWLVADELAAAKVPVIVDPMDNLPVRFESRNARADNAAMLARAGVTVALAARSSHNAGNLRFAAGNAIRAGFPEGLALRAVTRVPAQLFGQGRTLGTLESGRQANLVVWTGDPFEPSSHAERVFIRGRAQPVESRQTKLARRYMRRLGLGRRDAPTQ